MERVTAGDSRPAAIGILVHWFERIQGVKRARPRPADAPA